MLIILTISDDGQSIICEIYEKHHRRMLYTATNILGSARGEEAVHDVFVKLIEKFDKNNISNLADKPGLFFVIVVRNHSLDLLKRENATASLDDEDSDMFISSLVDPETALLDNEGHDMLVALIRRMKPTIRQILEYKYIVEYSNKEIAEIMGISQSAVSSRIDKAKKRLREMLKNEEVYNNEY